MSNGEIPGWLVDAGFSSNDATLIIRTLAERGVFLTTEDPTEQLKEWIERQEEERRAWAMGSAIETLKYASAWDGDTLVQLAGKFEAFVIGNQEDPDLHDQDALDNFAVSAAKVMGWVGPPEDEAEAWDRSRILDALELECTKAGVRFKNGKVLED